MSRTVAAALLAATVLSLPACRKADDSRNADGSTAEAAPPASPVSAPADSAAGLLGVWTVVAHHVPGVAAMSDVEASTWNGRTVRLSGHEALTEGSHCETPTYITRTTARDSLLVEFNLPPGSLPPLASRERLTLLEVSCGGARWNAIASRLIRVDADRALAPWNGVFFELARDHDFRAIGQEPGWTLEIVKGKEIVFTYAYGESRAVTPAPPPVTDSVTRIRSYHAVTEASDLQVEIDPRPCTDAMSGRPFETTVTVTLNRQTYRGCGGTP